MSLAQRAAFEYWGVDVRLTLAGAPATLVRDVGSATQLRLGDSERARRQARALIPGFDCKAEASRALLVQQPMRPSLKSFSAGPTRRSLPPRASLDAAILRRRYSDGEPAHTLR